MFFYCPLLIVLQGSGQEKLEIAGAIVIENSEETCPIPGTIRWTGSDFEGWNVIIWVSLTGGVKAGMVTDIDNNSYLTISIGDQEWMVENLNVTRYNDNTEIDSVTLNQSWAESTAGAWCYYDNNPNYNYPYGKLYNWHAVKTGKLCPTGWHVPSDMGLDDTDRLFRRSECGWRKEQRAWYCTLGYTKFRSDQSVVLQGYLEVFEPPKENSKASDYLGRTNPGFVMQIT